MTTVKILDILGKTNRNNTTVCIMTLSDVHLLISIIEHCANFALPAPYQLQ